MRAEREKGESGDIICGTLFTEGGKGEKSGRERGSEKRAARWREKKGKERRGVREGVVFVFFFFPQNKTYQNYIVL